MTIEPNSRQPKVKLSSLNVPRPKGNHDFFAPRLAAIAIELAMMGMKRLMMITRAVAISNCGAVGPGFGLLLKP